MCVVCIQYVHATSAMLALSCDPLCQINVRSFFVHHKEQHLVTDSTSAALPLQFCYLKGLSSVHCFHTLETKYGGSILVFILLEYTNFRLLSSRGLWSLWVTPIGSSGDFLDMIHTF